MDLDLGRPGKFDIEGEASLVATAWQNWLEEFECFADCKGLFNAAGSSSATNRRRRQALLFYCGGSRVREAFKSLNSLLEEDHQIKADDYDGTMKMLNEHFIVKPNVTFQRHQFRKMVQQTGETIAQFVARLRKASIGCDFHDNADMLKDQVVSNCLHDNLRKKFLEKGEKLDLSELLRISASHEAVEMQTKEMRTAAPSHNTDSSVNRVGANNSRTGASKKNQGGNKNGSSQNHGGARPKTTGGSNHSQNANSAKTGNCFRCGRSGHWAKAPNCPAKDVTCRSCGLVGHFQKLCRSETKDDNKGKKSVKHVGSDDADKAVFTCNGSSLSKVALKVQGIAVDFLVDSGSDSNIINLDTWEFMKAKGLLSEIRNSGIRLFPYTVSKPLDIYGSFNAEIEAGNQTVTAEIIVINDRGHPSLLGQHTSTALGILKIGIGVGAINKVVQGSYAELRSNYASLFDGIGKYTGQEIKFTIDHEVTPIAQPFRRIPFALRDKVEAKLKQLVDSDIIEQVNKPTQWISPLVVVPKANGSVRLCCDYRLVNQAIIRERHPIPTFEELLLDMNNSKVYSKLDMREGFNQFVLSPESRDITTFCSHVGLFRWKRLNYGTNMAMEKYQAEIQRLVSGIPGVSNLADDIIVHAPDRQTHDVRLIQVLNRLKDAGLTLNGDKTIFGVDSLEFVGHRLSAQGVDPMESKIESIVNAREPQTVSELRSWLGLCNYVSRFCPDYSTLTEPLRRLTKAGVDFEFGSEQKKAFVSLKKTLSSCDTLGYFDLKYPTKVIADASPVGLGAILVQEQEEGPRIISYASRSLTDVETRYCQTEKEALGLVWACERFRPYLIGIEFDLVTDHEPLKAIYGPRSKPSARIERWVLRLMPFDYRVVYWPGSKNIADPLSRLSGFSKGSAGKLPAAKAEQHVRLVVINSVPRAMSAKEIELASMSDNELQIVRQCVETGRFDQGVEDDQCNVTGYKIVKNELCVVGYIVLRGSRIVIPTKLRQHVIQLAHQGHMGIVGTKQNLRTKVWWPGIDKDVELFVKSCHDCQLVSKPLNPEPLQPTNLPNGPWEQLAIDHFGPIAGYQSMYLLVCIDYYSRYFECKVVNSTSAAATVECLDDMFQVHGLPLSVRSDNATCFVSHEFQSFCGNLGIKHVKTTPKYAAGNGLAESCMKSIKKRIQIAVTSGGNWKIELQKYLFSYRNTPHQATGKSPAELLFGRRLRTKIPDFCPAQLNDSEVRNHDEAHKAKVKKYTDQKRKAVESNIIVGDEVLLRRDQINNKTETRFYPDPCTVVNKFGSQVTVRTSDGREFKRNSSHLKPYLRAREISPQSFVGAGVVGNQEEEGESANQSRANQNRDLGTPIRQYDDTPIRRSCRDRAVPDRFTYYSRAVNDE